MTRQTLGILAVGIAAGLTGAVLMSRVVGAPLYGVSPLDPVSLVITPALLLLARLAAAAAPALRASQADPSVGLRDE